MSEKPEWSNTFYNLNVYASSFITKSSTGDKISFTFTCHGRKLTPEETRDALMSMVWILNEAQNTPEGGSSADVHACPECGHDCELRTGGEE